MIVLARLIVGAGDRMVVLVRPQLVVSNHTYVNYIGTNNIQLTIVDSYHGRKGAEGGGVWRAINSTRLLFDGQHEYYLNLTTEPYSEICSENESSPCVQTLCAYFLANSVILTQPNTASKNYH